MAAKGKFKYGNRDIPMTMTFSLAYGKMSELGIDVLGVIADNGRTIQTILLDDRTVLNIWFYYVHEETADEFDDALGVLDNTEGGLQQFREEFFQLVVNFSSPQTRKVLTEMWDQAKIQMKDSRRIKSLVSSFELSEELDSTLEDTPSEKS